MIRQKPPFVSEINRRLTGVRVIHQSSHIGTVYGNVFKKKKANCVPHALSEADENSTIV